jgi:prepilin-type N-terminal cleavage/methylation domain-containing protein
MNQMITTNKYSLKSCIGFTLIELIVVLAIISVIMGLILASLQRSRLAAARSSCQNNLRQLGLASQNYINQYDHLPPGNSGNPSPTPYLGWLPHLLPYIDQADIYKQSQSAFLVDKDFRDPPHPSNIVLSLFYCSLDSRCANAVNFGTNMQHIALTSYLGNQGLDYHRLGGVLFIDSHVAPSEITDGLSNTLLAGERPPSSDEILG